VVWIAVLITGRVTVCATCHTFYDVFASGNERCLVAVFRGGLRAPRLLRDQNVWPSKNRQYESGTQQNSDQVGSRDSGVHRSKWHDLNPPRLHCSLVQIGVGVTSRANRSLYHAIALLPKEFVGVGDSIKRKRVRQQWSQIQPPVPDELHQPAHALSRLPGLRPVNWKRAARGNLNPVVFTASDVRLKERLISLIHAR
jgi:hypothetical protein